MKIAKKHCLHHKLAKSVFGAALLFAGLTSAVFFLVERERASDKTEVLLNQLLDTVETTAAVAAYSGNRQIGDDLLKGLLRNDFVHEARLSNDRELELRQTRGTKVSPQAEVTRILRSPFGEEETIGHLTVIPEAQFNFLEARRSAVFSAVNSSLLIGLTALLVLSLVRSSLSRPLLKVSLTLHAISAGEQERLEPLPRHQDDELGQLVGDINSLLEKLDEKFEAEHLLREEIQSVENQLRSIFENTSAGIFLLDETGRLLTANPTLGRVLGFHPADQGDWRGPTFLMQAFAKPERMRTLMRLADERGKAVALDLQLKCHGSDSPSWVHCLLSRQAGGVGGAHYEGVVYDVTERHATEEHARHEADYDPLTGLLRRQAAERDIVRLLNTVPERVVSHALLLLDLDNFKPVNDNHGHAVGDVVLVEVARRFKSCVRTGDIVARLGGDEFLIVLVNCITPDRACQIARDIVRSIAQPIPFKDALSLHVGVSVGIVIYEEHGKSLEELLRHADQAMYEVKHQGRNGFAIRGGDGVITVERVVLDAAP